MPFIRSMITRAVVFFSILISVMIRGRGPEIFITAG